MKSDTRDRAYRAAAHITRKQLRRDAPDRARALDEVKASDVVVVAGIVVAEKKARQRRKP